MRPAAAALGLILAWSSATQTFAADEPKPTVVDLWPGAAPGETGAVGEEKATLGKDGKTVVSLTNVTKPTLTVFRPPHDKNTGVAVVVAPGGGYHVLAWDHEGEQVGRWLNSIGVTAFVLKYRVPRRPDTPKEAFPLQALIDAQRAVSLVKSRATDYGVDPKRVGMLGFSAGGHLTAWTSTAYDRRTYEPVDDADKAIPRPDFAVLIYPGGLVAKESEPLSPDIRVTSQTPPTFLVHAFDDKVENSVAMYTALKRAGVPSEMHLYASGGHGFGIRATGKPSATWPKRCEEWLRDLGVLKKVDGK